MKIRATKNTLDPDRLPPLLTVGQYADITQQKEPAVRAQLRAGTLPGCKISKKLWRIPRDVVRRYLEAAQ